MKITLEALDGRNFTLRIPLDGGRGEHVIALHDTKRLRGAYDHDATRFSLDPVEADAIVGEVAWALAEGSFRLAGPAVLGATHIDLDIRRDDQTPGVTGEVRCASLDAPVTRLERAGLELVGALSFTSFHAAHDVTTGRWTVTAQELVVRGVSFAVGETAVRASAATITGLRLSRDATGAMTVEADAAELTDVEVGNGGRRVRSPSLRLGALRYAPDGASVGQLIADELSLAIEGLAADGGERAAPQEAPSNEPAAGTRRTLGVDLALLDGLEGKVEADVVVDIKLPLLKHRVATHRVDLEIADGAIDFKQLEHGLSPLEDAIIDFEVVDEGLQLELDAVVVKRELLLWPLDAEGMRRARQNRVRLRTLVRPTMEVRAASPRDDGDGDPSVALERLELRGLRLEGTLRGGSSLPVAGGTLRLGGAEGKALGPLRLRGEVVHDVTKPVPDTELAWEIADLDVGVDALAVGARRLDVERLHIGQITEGRITLHGMRPTAVTATLRAIALKGLRLVP